MLRQTSQFSLSVTVASGDTAQQGPARIISLSRDPYHRNFTLGQEGSHLVFRLRTPLTGGNGKMPELIVPNVFANNNLHQLVITYDGSALILYVDGVQRSPSLELTPGAALFSQFFPLSGYNMKGYKALYYGLVFVPLGCLIALILYRLESRLMNRAFILGLGVFLPPLIVFNRF